MSTEDSRASKSSTPRKNDPSYNLPYAPAIVVNGGRLLFTAAMAAPTYHHHPHRPEEFDHLPEDTAEQARLTMEQLKEILAAAGGTPERRGLRDPLHQGRGRQPGRHQPGAGPSTSATTGRRAAPWRSSGWRPTPG